MQREPTLPDRPTPRPAGIRAAEGGSGALGGAGSPGPDRPALVAVGFNRTAALARLLESLRAAQLPPETPLVISLDWSGDNGPAALAQQFAWPHGSKRIILHPQNLGLRRHILACGDLALEYGAVALFEDDLLVAPHFHAWLTAAIAAYADDDRIGGISLYDYRINEFNNMDFEPIADGSDVYFLQVAASWGQAWTAGQWSAFRTWYAEHQHDPFEVEQGIPRQLAAWRDNSWKRFYIKYLAMTGRTFAYPRASLTTNRAVPGTNTRRGVSIYQTPLDMGRRDWRLPSLDSALGRYDTFYEPEACVLRHLQPALADEDFDVDLFGTKPAGALKRPNLLSSRAVLANGSAAQPKTAFGRRATERSGYALVSGGPPCTGIVAGERGSFFRLAPRDAFGGLSLARRHALARATQCGSVANALLFQLLKPIQVELMIARRERARTLAVNHG